MRARPVILILALAATLGATLWAALTPDREAPPAKAVRPGPAGGNAGAAASAGGETAPVAPPPLTPERFRRAPLAEQPAPQVALAWGPPPPPPPPKMSKGYKPPPPPPPALPFKSIGRMEEGGAVTAFLLGTDRTYAVRTGDTIDGNYRVEEVTARHVVFTFLPLKARQELSLEGPQ